MENIVEHVKMIRAWNLSKLEGFETLYAELYRLYPWFGNQTFSIAEYWDLKSIFYTDPDYTILDEETVKEYPSIYNIYLKMEEGELPKEFLLLVDW